MLPLNTPNVQRVVCLISIDAKLPIKLLCDASICATRLTNAVVMNSSLVALATRSSSAALDEDAFKDVVLDVDTFIYRDCLLGDLVAVTVLAVSYDKVVGADGVGDAAQLQRDCEEAQETGFVHFEDGI